MSVRGNVVKHEIRVTDQYPLLLIEFFGAPDDVEFAGYIAKVEAIAERGATRPQLAGRSVILFDTTHSTQTVTASQRKMQAAHMLRMKAKVEALGTDVYQTGVCFVLTNAVARGVLTAILWLQPVAERYEVCSTRKEADQWCRQWVVGLSRDPTTSNAKSF